MVTYAKSSVLQACWFGLSFENLAGWGLIAETMNFTARPCVCVLIVALGGRYPHQLANQPQAPLLDCDYDYR